MMSDVQRICTSTMDSTDCEEGIITEKSSDKRHICSYKGCNASFKKYSLLERHMVKHTNERPYLCDVDGCNQSFQQSYHLKRHKLCIHNQIDEFACDEENCKKVFSNSFSLKKHKARIHSPATLHECPQCLKEFKKKYQLRNHILSHGNVLNEGKGEYEQYTSKAALRCSFEGCTASYRKMSYLTLHMRKHTGERPFVCDIVGCDKSYTKAYHLKRHKARAHETTKEYICKEKDCGKVLSDKHTFQKHRDRYHSVTGPYKCMHCMQGFYKKYVLRKHLAAHFEEGSPFRCKMCNLVFPTRTNYLKHMSCHKSYNCDCGKVFQRWTNFRGHKKSCNGQKTVHVCAICNKSFTSYFNLKQHSIVHSETKEIFRCHYLNCDRSYNYKKNLMFHITHFHEKTAERYECSLPGCTMTFKLKSYMKRHVENVHMNPKEKNKERKPRKDKGIPKSDKHIAMSGLNPSFKKLLKNNRIEIKEEERDVTSKESKLSKVAVSSNKTLLENSEDGEIPVEKNVVDTSMNELSNVAIDMLEVCYSTENSRESSADEGVTESTKESLNTEASHSNSIENKAVKEATNDDQFLSAPEANCVSEIQSFRIIENYNLTFKETEGDTIEMNNGLEVEFVDSSVKMSCENDRGESQSDKNDDQDFNGSNDTFSKIVILKVDCDVDLIKECDSTLERIKSCIG